VPFDDLNESEQRKDAILIAVAQSIGRVLEVTDR